MMLVSVAVKEDSMPGKPPPTMSEVRAWAREKDIPVNVTGNVPNDVVAAFNRGRPPHRRFERATRQDLVETR